MPNDSENTLRVLIADDHALFRDGLRSLLEARSIEVVGEASTADEAVTMARSIKPDVVFMDVQMPGTSGLAVIPQLSQELPDVKVIVLTASEDDRHLAEAMRNGAQGYLLKNLQPANRRQH